MTGLDHQSKVREKFNQFDTDNDGFIDMNEILNYYSEYEEEAAKIHKNRYIADKNKDNLLNFEEFESFFSKVFTLSADDAELRKLFENIDTNHNGNISLSEYWTYLISSQEMNEQSNKAYIKAAKNYMEADENDDDKLNFEEFKDLITKIAKLE